MAAFSTWYQRTHGWGRDQADLYAELVRGGGGSKGGGEGD
jgi:hypothetical protein